MTDKKRVALYIRVSSEEQKREGLSLESQLRKLQEYCQFKDWYVFKVYKDEGISGSSISKRKQFQQLLEDANLGKFSTILIMKFDRAFRNTKEALNTFDDLKEKNIDFVSISEDIDTTSAMGKFFFIIISAFAQLEKDMTADRNKFVSMDKFDRGIFPSRMPFGYKPIYKNKKDKNGVIGVEIDKKQAEIVSDCFKMAFEGVSYKDICKKHKLKPQQFYNIIRNKVYCGYIQFDGKEKKGTHPQIISEEIYNEIHKKTLSKERL